MELKERVEKWMYWYRSWYEIPNDYNKDIISGKNKTGLDDRAIDAGNIIKDQQQRIQELEAENLKYTKAFIELQQRRESPKRAALKQALSERGGDDSRY